MARDVFTCHSSHDTSVADKVCAQLEAAGLSCWIAPRHITPGVGWGKAIVKAIAACRVMVVVFSAASNESPQARREVERAVNRRVPVLPFRIENVFPDGAMEYFISSAHWLDATRPPLDGHLRRLEQNIRQLLDLNGQPPPRPPVSPLTRRGRHPKAFGWAVTLVMVLALIALGAAVAILLPGRAAKDDRPARWARPSAGEIEDARRLNGNGANGPLGPTPDGYGIEDARRLNGNGAWRRALDICDRLLRLDPQNSEAREIRAEILKREGDMVKEIRELMNAGDLRSASMKAEPLRQFESGDPRAAEALARLGSQLRRSRELLAEARSAEGAGDYGRALSLLGELQRFDVGNAEASVLRGTVIGKEKAMLSDARAREAGGDMEGAMGAFSELLRHDPGNAEAQAGRERLERQIQSTLRLAEQLLADGDPKGAMESLRPLERGNPNAGAQDLTSRINALVAAAEGNRKEGDTLLAKGDYASATARYRLSASGGNAAAMQRLGTVYFQGLGTVPKDNHAAEIWFLRSARNGNARAMFCLAVMTKGSDDLAAADWLGKAARTFAAETWGECVRTCGERPLLRLVGKFVRPLLRAAGPVPCDNLPQPGKIRGHAMTAR